MRRIFLMMMLMMWGLGCGFGAAFEQASEHDMMFASDGSSGASSPTTTAPPVEVTGDSEAVHTVTSASTGAGESSDGVDDTASSTGSDGPDIEPVMVAWLGPADVWAVGLVELAVAVSDNVVAVDLHRGGEFVATLTPPQWSFDWEVLGDAQDGEHVWTAVARSADDEQAEAELVIGVDVPASGLPVWQEVRKTDGVGWARSVAVDDNGGAVALGYQTLDKQGTVLRRYQDGALAWMLMANQWSVDAALLVSTDVALDPEGNIIVAGNIGNRYYLGKLTAGGQLLWERIGNEGETADGVSVDDEGRIYLAGAAKIGDDTKLMVWSWAGNNTKPWIGEWEFKEDPDHLRSERGHAVVRIGDRVIVVGERQVWDDEKKVLVERTLVVQFTLAGELLDELTWTSNGDWGGRDVALDITAVGDEYCTTGRSRGPDPAAWKILTHCSDGLQPWWSSEDDFGVGRSVASNRRLEVVVAGEAAGRGQVRGFVPGAAAPAWTFTTSQHGSLNGVACDAWGRCTFAGATKGPPLQWMAGALTP